MKWQFAVLEFIEGRIEDHTNRTGVRCPVSQTSAAAIDGASVHASAATDAFQRMPEFGHRKASAAPIVHHNDMQFAALPRSGEMRRVLRERSAFSTSRKQSQENAHIFHSRNDLLYANAGDMNGRDGGTDVSIPLIGANHEGSCFGDCKIAARHSRFSGEKSGASVIAHDLPQKRRIVLCSMGTDRPPQNPHHTLPGLITRRDT